MSVKFGLTDDEFRSDFNWDPNASAVTSPREAAPIYQLERYRVRGPVRHWQSEVLGSVLRLAKLPRNWDSYGAKTIAYDTALFAMLVLDSIMQTETPIPSVVPTSAGGIQFEWHEHDIDLEIEVIAPNRCEYWFADLRGQLPESSAPLENDFHALARPISVLTSRARPARRQA
jgi:hypothetical protein